MIWATAPQHPGNDRQVHSYLDYLDLRAQNHTFTAMAGLHQRLDDLGHG